MDISGRRVKTRKWTERGNAEGTKVDGARAKVNESGQKWTEVDAEWTEVNAEWTDVDGERG